MRFKRSVSKLSASTLIIYLLHMLFLYVMYDNQVLYSLHLSPWIFIWIYAIVAYAGGYIAAQGFHLIWDPISSKRMAKQQ